MQGKARQGMASERMNERMNERAYERIWGVCQQSSQPACSLADNQTIFCTLCSASLPSLKLLASRPIRILSHTHTHTFAHTHVPTVIWIDRHAHSQKLHSSTYNNNNKRKRANKYREMFEKHADDLCYENGASNGNLYVCIHGYIEWTNEWTNQPNNQLIGCFLDCLYALTYTVIYSVYVWHCLTQYLGKNICAYHIHKHTSHTIIIQQHRALCSHSRYIE